MRRALPLLAFVLAAAPPAAPLTLRPGLWRVTNTAGGASLDGRALTDLPVAPPGSETMCLSPADAKDAIRWLGEDLLPHCATQRQVLRGGQLDLTGRCEAPDKGQPEGRLHLSGRWSPSAYALAFDTVAHGENGVMGFTGRLAGERLGDCPAG